MRLFVGIPLAPAVNEELSAISARLHADGDGLRWPAPESWHVTLQFLGNTGREQYDCTIARLRGVHSPPIPVMLEGLSFFDRAGIFFAGVRLTPELLVLQERVTAATKLCGFTPEARAFQPHITLARSKGKGQRQSLGELKAKIRHQPNFTPFVAEEFLLYESFLGRAGSHYEVRERFALGRR
jgi:2'-5' RNA ligase